MKKNHFRSPFLFCALFLLCIPKSHALSLEDSLYILNPFTQREALKHLFDTHFSILGVDNQKLVEKYSIELETARKMNRTADIQRILTTLGDIYIHTTLSSRALKYYSDALEIARQLKDSINTALLYMKIGRTYYFGDLRNLQSDYINRGYEVLKNCEDIEIRAKAFYYKGALEDGSELAQSLFAEALRLQLKVISTKPGDYSANQFLARYLYANNREEEAISIAEKINDNWLLIIFLNNRGMSKFLEKKYDEAMEYYQRSLRLSINARLKGLLKNTIVNMAELYRGMGEWEKASKFQYMHSILDESIYNERYNDLYSEFQAKFQNELKDDRIRDLQIETNRLSDILGNEKLVNYLLGFLLVSLSVLIALVYSSRKKLKTLLAELNSQHTELSEQKSELDILHGELKRSERHLKYAQEIAGLANWEWDLEGDRFTYSDQMAEVFGVHPDELKKNFRDTLLSRIVPEDREIVSTYFYHGRNSEQYHEREYRISHPKGIRWINSKYSTRTDENGVLIKITGTVQDISRLKEEEEVKLEAASQRAFTGQLIKSQEDERKRIAYELHDSFGQDLLFIKTKTKLAMRDKKIVKLAGSYLNEIDSSIDTMLSTVRDIAGNLKPLHLERIGLSETVIELLSRASGSTSIKFSHEIDRVNGKFSTDKELAIYRVIQEAVNNIVKHSKAENASVKLAIEENNCSLIISDDGIGLVTPEGEENKGFGLSSMSHRINLLNGDIRFTALQGGGTEIIINIPVEV